MPWAEGGGECQGRGNLGEGPDHQDRQVAIVGEGERRRGRCHRKLSAPLSVHACWISEGRVALAQTMGTQKPLTTLGEIGHLCRLPVARHLLYGLRASGG